MSNEDIEAIVKKLKIKNFRGVYSKDMLPNKINDNELVVLNIENFMDGGGTHWTSFYSDSKSKDIEYFGSFGIIMPDIVKKYLLTANKGLVYNSTKLQSDNSFLCGWYCIYFLNEKNKGRSFFDILMDFDQKASSYNENKITIFANEIMSR